MASPNQLSFLPDDYMEKKLRRRTNAILGTLFLVVVIAIGGTLFLRERATRAMLARKANLEMQLTEAAKPIEQFNQMQQKQQELGRQADITASLLERVPRSYLLAEITNAIPSGVSLIDFNLASKLRPNKPAPAAKTAFDKRKAQNNAPEKDLPQARFYDVTMRLTGVAATDVQVAQFMSKLNHSTLLQDVNLVVSEQFKKGNDVLRKFQVEMTLNPNAQVSIDEFQKDTATAAIPLDH